MPVISVTDEVAQRWLDAAGKQLGDLQAKLDTGEPMMGFTIPDSKLAASIAIQPRATDGTQHHRAAGSEARRGGRTGRDRWCSHRPPGKRGGGGSSLAKEEEAGEIHRGADDNASGVAAVLEMAQYLSASKRTGEFRIAI